MEPTRRTSRIVAAFLVASALSGLSSCGGSGPTTTTPPTTTPPTTTPTTTTPTTTTPTTTTVKDGDYTITETTAGKLPDKVVRFIANPDATGWASISTDPSSKKSTVMSDSKTIGTYGGVHSMQYTKAGKLVYVAGPVPFPDEGLNSPRTPANDMRIVINGVEGHGYENVMAYPPGWVASSMPRAAYQQIIAFSNDGTRIAIAGSRGGASYVEVDGKEFGPYKMVRDIAFSADSKHFGWIISDGKADAVMIDGAAPEPTRGHAEYLTFNADASSWAYLEDGAGSNPTVVRKGKGATTYPGVYTGIVHVPPEFTPDGNHVISRAGGLVILDNKRIEPQPQDFGIVARVYVHPDTHEVVCEGTRKIAFYSLAGEHLRTQAREESDGVLWTMQSPDHRRTVTAESQSRYGGGELWNLGGGKKLKLGDGQALNMGVAWGPTNKFAMVTGRSDVMGGRSGAIPMSIVVEDQLGAAVYDQILREGIGFSPDGRHVAYPAEKQKEYLLVVDTEELSPRYEQVGAGLTYDSNDAFHFVALRKSEVLRVRVSR